jgi:hypothetical protein
MEGDMSGSVARGLFCVIFTLVSFSSNAFDLNGAWTTDDSNCHKIFVTKNKKVMMTRHADVHGGGFIIEGNQIRGPAKTCKITGRKEEGGVLNLIATCSTDIAVLGTQQVNIKIEGDDRLTRIFPSFPEMGTTYYRCKL